MTVWFLFFDKYVTSMLFYDLKTIMKIGQLYSYCKKMGSNFHATTTFI